MFHVATRVVFLLAVMTFASGSTLISYGRNYGEWQKLNAEAKIGYALGSFDSKMSFNPMGAPAELSYLIGIQKCTTGKGVTPLLLVRLIDEYYKSHKSSWKLPASEVLEHALYETCKSEVDAELEKAGLPVQP
jgi:hypothetical protein